MDLRTVALVAVSGLLLAGCGGGGSSPDRIVGKILKCDRRVTDRVLALTEQECRDDSLTINWRMQLTIKAADGKTYTVETQPNDTVALGDEWPPK